MKPDIIVVGGGSGGCVVAARLSEDPGRHVLLLEAGPAGGGIASRIPAAFNKLFKGPTDWAYETEPDPGCGGRRHFWPRGRMLGGCGAMNAMIWTRGDAADFDGWAAGGAEGWAWRDVVPWFDRLALRPEPLPRYNPITEAFVSAARSSGIPANEGFIDGRMNGVGRFLTSTRGGERNSPERACLRPARGRATLAIRTGVLVERIVFERGRACGVEVRTGPGTTETIVAKRGVVLAAGAIGTPLILLRSGIGPRDELARHRVTQILDAPEVGENLSDHLACGLGYRSREPVTLEGARGPAAFLQWLLLKRGPLTSNIAEAGAFLTVNRGSPAPDIEVILAPAWFVDHGFRQFSGHGFVLGVVGLRPESRGRLRLGGPHAMQAPRIDAGYFSHPSDQPTMLEGMRRAMEIADASALARYRGELVAPSGDARSDDTLIAHLRDLSQTLYHPAGTCRMGNDPGAVVDPTLKLRGVGGVWIADASVMPRLVSGHPNAAVMMIGERAAELIHSGLRQSPGDG